MKIVVLAGGLSPERDVSLSSGSLIANALMETGHEVLLLDVYEGARDKAVFRSRAGGGAPYAYVIPDTEPDLEAVKRRNGGRSQWIGPGVLELCRQADVTFLALHGAMGENGQLQAVLDCEGIRYTGTGYAGSLLAMDKDLTKQLLCQNGIPTAPWVLCGRSEEELANAVKTTGLPCVVKPCGCGSSVGVSMAYTQEELRKAVLSARQYEELVLVEQMVPGREFSVGILDGAALPPIEIIPLEGFYDYKNKYQAGRTEEICPAPLSAEETHRIQALALKTHRALRLGGYSRVDFILDAAGTFVCLEANTLPGMTPTSLLPQEAAQAGISYEALCETIARLALEDAHH